MRKSHKDLAFMKLADWKRYQQTNPHNVRQAMRLGPADRGCRGSALRGQGNPQKLPEDITLKWRPTGVALSLRQMGRKSMSGKSNRMCESLLNGALKKTYKLCWDKIWESVEVKC